MSDRRTLTNRDVIAGCFDCQGSTQMWQGGHAQGVAARHHDATGHQTWVTVSMNITYGNPKTPQSVIGGGE